jgi:hypothetical protein
MAILKASLEEPLLSRDETIVIRAIAHVAQIAEAYKALQMINDGILKDQANQCAASNQHLQSLNEYLKHKALRVLTQIKIPKVQALALKDETNVA